MGAYLSQPITEKNSSDEKCDVFCYGASSMQGWRVSQEDAHNCIPNFSENTSFFAVYDGHGGAEVAQYCSLHLPEYLKTVPSFKSKEFKKALEEAFLSFDSTLKSENVLQELKQLVAQDFVEPDENETELLNEEAFMPLDELLAKYSEKQAEQPSLNKLKRKEKVQSPLIRAKRCTKLESEDVKAEIAKESLTGSSEEVKTDEQKCNLNMKFNGDIKDVHSDSNYSDIANEEINNKKNSNSKSKAESEDICLTKETEKPKNCSASSQQDENENSSKKLEIKDNQKKIENGEQIDLDSDDSSTSAEQGPSRVNQCRTRIRTQFTSVEDNSDDDDDDDDEDFDENEENEDDDDDDGDDDDEKDDSEDEEYEQVRRTDEADFSEDMVSSGKDEPGQDSGCTAVVALLHYNDLYVANAGDSRCVISRKGKAIEMSIDHKPEDSTEMTRIKNAGGRVTSDGRVNGGLNLSRAIGDHFYKKNTELPAEEQMITALPDVRSIRLDEDDEFMVLACDGIWNFMTSQEVVDFVKERLSSRKEKLSSICEELFDHCLAPNTYGDGTGCDNMTCIIICFDIKKMATYNADSMKRQCDASGEMSSSKRIKLNQPSDP